MSEEDRFFFSLLFFFFLVFFFCVDGAVIGRAGTGRAGVVAPLGREKIQEARSWIWDIARAHRVNAENILEIKGETRHDDGRAFFGLFFFCFSVMICFFPFDPCFRIILCRLVGI